MHSRYTLHPTNLPQLQLSQDYQPLLIPHKLSKYQYSKGIPYIRLSQQKISNDVYLYDFTHVVEETKIIKTYILDRNLGVVYEGGKRDFQEERYKLEKEKEKGEEMVIGVGNTGRGNQIIQQYEHDGQQVEHKQDEIRLNPIVYRTFPTLNDFMIGRYKFIRNFQSHKICSDSISKQHCSISHFHSNNEHVNTYLKTIKKLLVTKTPLHTKYRKIPTYLWDSIYEYLKPRQRYTLCDLGSRNGTWVCELGTQRIVMQQNLDYQFQNQSYSIHVSKMFTSSHTQPQSILQHNKKAHKILQQYKKQINWNYYERANKIIIVQDIQNLQTKTDQKIQIIIFKLKYRDYYQYYLLAINQSISKKYTIGCKYDIDINPEEYDMPSLHGRVWVRAGKWVIEGEGTRRAGVGGGSGGGSGGGVGGGNGVGVGGNGGSNYNMGNNGVNNIGNNGVSNMGNGVNNMGNNGVNNTISREGNGEFRKIWVRCPKMYKYVFDVKKEYKIRLGVSYHLGLKFVNF